MKTMSQKALEDFLNDEVTQVRGSIFSWRGKNYQCCTIKNAKIQGLRMDQFIKHTHNGKVFVIREYSDRLMKMLLDN